MKRTWQKMLCCRECTLSASWTSQICSPVAGLQAGKTFPLTESCHSLLMKICREENAVFRWNDGSGSWRQREVILQPYSNWFYLKHLSLSEWYKTKFFLFFFFKVCILWSNDFIPPCWLSSSPRLLCKGYGRISGNLDTDSCRSSIALWGVLHHPDKRGGGQINPYQTPDPHPPT